MANGKVLIIDDCEANRFLCKEVLMLKDFSILEADNGNEGIKIAEEENPDMILLDILMPNGIDGYEVLALLKDRNDQLSTIPVVMFSAQVDPNGVVRALSMGADDYIKKPIDIAELSAKTELIVKKRLLEKERANDIGITKKIQSLFLTDDSQLAKQFGDIGFNHVFYNLPASEISGDFIYTKAVGNFGAGLFFADTCGHGISAALISMRILSMIENVRSPASYASEFLSAVNEDLIKVLPPERFVAATYLIAHSSGEYCVSSGGQPRPILIQGSKISEINTDGPPIGQIGGTTYPDKKGVLKSGNKMLLYTDGLVEQENQNGDMYGEERLLKTISTVSTKPLEEILKAITDDFQTFIKDVHNDDDITIFAIERR